MSMSTVRNAGNVLPTKNVFSTSNNWEVRHVLINKEPWFVAKDVCDALGLSNITEALRSLDDYEKLTSVIMNSGQHRKTWFIHESGLYRLIFKSRKPEAKAFQKWVVTEVLPSIRKTGKYSIRGKARMSDEARELVADVKRSLVKGDLGRVCAELGLSYSHVSKVSRGETISHRVMQALIDQAAENRQAGIQLEFGYGRSFISANRAGVLPVLETSQNARL